MNVFHTKPRPQVLQEGTDTFEPEATAAKLDEMTINISKALESYGIVLLLQVLWLSDAISITLRWSSKSIIQKLS